MSSATGPGWPVPTEVGEPEPPERRRAWGKLPHEERYKRQRRDLLRAAGRIASRSGYQGTRVADIVAEAGLSKSTFYEHFDSKEECFVELHERTSVGMLQAGVAAAEANIETGPFEAVLSVIKALLGYVDQDPRLARALRAELGAFQPAIQEQRQHNLRGIADLFVTLATKLGTTLDPGDLDTSATVIVHGVTAILPDLDRRTQDFDRHLEAFARLGCRALGLDA
jgi:AcrR family transcriptional regulator